MSRSLTIRNLIFILSLCGIMLSTGCALFPGKKANEQAVPVAANQSHYTVHMQNWKAAPSVYHGTFDGNITIEDALKASGAKKRYRSMEIDLVRKSEEGRIVKMPAQYDTRKKRVKPEQDYHIRSGDQVVVRLKSEGAFDKIITSVFGSTKTR